MSSTRNKRKRPDSDTSTMGGASRRRSRETRAPPIAAPLADAQNETVEEKKQNGEPSTKPLPKTAQSPLLEAKSKLDKPGEATKSTNETIGKSSGKNASGNSEQGKNAQEASAEESGPSQTESVKPTQPLHISEPPDVTSKIKEEETKKGTDRGAKLQGLVRHRSILLARIRLCRSAAERRLGENDYSFTGRTKASQDVTDENEIAGYRELTRKASQAAKKSKSDVDATTDKRTSLSLRRGSSVGKRMNAALSSLAPGSNATSSDGTPFALVQPVTIAPSKAISKPPQAQTSLPKSSSKSAFQTIPAEKHKLVPPTNVLRPVPPTASLNKPSSSTSSSIHLSTTKQALSSDAALKSRAPNLKGIKTVARQSSISTAPLQTVANPTAVPSNRLAPQKVHFPLAVGLRAKREMIQSKLNSLTEQRRNDLPRGKSSNKKKKPIPSINPPFASPPRRKTHWDGVLQEMRWMATDFVEERKWKISIARTIASSIPAPGISVVSPGAWRNRKRYSNESMKGIETGNLEKECKLEMSDEAMTLTAPPAANLFKAEQDQFSLQKRRVKIDTKEYAKPSSDDVKSTRQLGRVISAMVFELVETTVGDGPFKDTDELSNKALDRFLENRSLILNGAQEYEVSTNNQDKTENGENVVNGFSNEIPREGNEALRAENLGEQVEEVPFQTITEYVDSLGKNSGKIRGKVSVKEMANAMKAEKFQFGGEQKHALEFVDRLWGSKPCIGGVLEGPPASGKTIAACTLLWKHRFKGPQLIICSPTSVLRWKFEMGRFEDIRVLTVGLTGGICSPSNTEIIEPEEGDVLICEYSTTDRALGEFHGKENPLHSLIVDCRHPSAFFTCNEDIDKEEDQMEWHSSTELGTIMWWERMTGFLKGHEARCLLIQYSDEANRSIVTSGVVEREQLEILSLRAASVLGAKTFLSDKMPLQRRIMLWARQRGKAAISDKSTRVKRVLDDAIDPLVFRMTESLASCSDIQWDVRLCAMPTSQRKSYDKCCSEVRGALSRSLLDFMDPDASFRSFEPILGALSRLRRQCFHSSGVNAFSVGLIQNRLGHPQRLFHRGNLRNVQRDKPNAVFWRKIKDSPAQPEIALALDFMKNSAKLRELASILIFDCGMHTYREEQIRAFLQTSKSDSTFSSSNREGDPKKVAILAVLPEIQILLSTFLNSLGIHHDLLYRAPLQDMDSGAPDMFSCSGHSVSNPYHLSALAYAEQQNSLSRFGLDNNGQAELGCYSSTNVVISSPEQVGCWMGGLGLESANYVVCVDEDYTCRGDFLLRNLLSRCLGRIAAKGEAPELVQLVCEDTLEERIFGYRSLSDTKRTYKLGCQLDATCLMQLPESSASMISSYHDAVGSQLARFTPLPALSLLKLRNVLLSEILMSSQDLPARFLSSGRVRFLPGMGANADYKKEQSIGKAVEKASEIAFIREFLRYERVASSRNPVSFGTANFQSNSATELLAPNNATTLAWPPLLQNFPRNLMTRQELCILSTLFFFEKQSSASVWKPFNPGSIPVPLAKLPSPASRVEVAADIVASTVNNAADDLAEAWRKSGLSCKPYDLAKSLLFYGTSVEVRGPRRAIVGTADPCKPKKPQRGGTLIPTGRFNAYAKLYSASWHGDQINDGNQGSEGLVFFPPLFPETHECPRIALGQLKAILSDNQEQRRTKPDSAIQLSNHAMTGISTDIPEEKKRKDDFAFSDSLPPNSKRMRSEDPAALLNPTSLSQPPPPLDMSSDDLLDSLEGILDDEDDDAPFAPIDPPLGSLIPDSDPLMAESDSYVRNSQIVGMSSNMKNESSVVTEEEASAEGLEFAIMGFDEDFGLLGAGALPTIGDASAESRYTIIHAADFTTADFLCNPCSGDSEELYASKGFRFVKRLNTVMLFVKRKPGNAAQLDGQTRGPPPSVTVTGGNWAGSNLFHFPMGVPGHETTFKDMNGSDPAKKLKKKAPSQTPLPAVVPLSRPSGSDTNSVPVMKPLPAPNTIHFTTRKDSKQHQLLASYASRHFVTGLSMFESASYQVASLKVKDRFEQHFSGRRLEGSNIASEGGHGSPHRTGNRLRPFQEAAKCTSGPFEGFVHALGPNCTIGDAARVLASSQRLSLRRSLIAPCRVDFGPFNSGFLAVPSGMTGISPPRSRLGVSLPMGVKVSQIREQRSTWTNEDDELLQDCATRFGMNWMIVARALNGFEDARQKKFEPAACSDPTGPCARSARQCRDRWQALARNRPSLANEIRKSERVLRESAMIQPHDLPYGDTTAVRTRSQVRGGIRSHAVPVLSKPSFADQMISTGAIPKEPSAAHVGNPAAIAPLSTLEPSSTVGESERNTINQAESTSTTRPFGPTTTARRGFGAFSCAKAKKQFVPITVPAVPSGGQPNQPVQSHTSHLQSVEASVAAQWSSGRTEMWPLQILDCAEKYRAAGRPVTSGQRSSSNQDVSQPRRQTPSSHSQRSRVQPSSTPREGTGSFPTVPNNASRNSAHRQGAMMGSPPRNPSGPSPVPKIYPLPKKSDEKPKRK